MLSLLDVRVMTTLSSRTDDLGPHLFSPREMAAASDLFAERSALFFTPTQNLPPKWVGSGNLDVKLPVPVPSWLEYQQVPGYRSPCFWVDHLQRVTGKIRWRSLKRVRLKIVVYDSYVRGADMIVKPVIDALKIQSNGRRDGRVIYYFGAIDEDNWEDIDGWDVVEEYVSKPDQVGCRLIVEPTPSTNQRSSHVINHPRRGLTRALRTDGWLPRPVRSRGFR